LEKQILHNAETKERVALSLEKQEQISNSWHKTDLIPLTYKVMHSPYYTSTWTSTGVFLN